MCTATQEETNILMQERPSKAPDEHLCRSLSDVAHPLQDISDYLVKHSNLEGCSHKQDCALVQNVDETNPPEIQEIADSTETIRNVLKIDGTKDKGKVKL